MSVENPLWGAPRIHGELLKLGFEVSQSSVAKYMVRRPRQPSQGWRTFLRNHAPDIAAMDLFVVPTLSFKLLYAFVMVRLDRRALIWINVAKHPTAEWIARQITEAFPWNEAPRYLIRDRDRIFGAIVARRLRAMGIGDKPIAPSSPWQNGFAERLIGSVRRECVDHLIVLSEAHLRRILRSYAQYYNQIRTHAGNWARAVGLCGCTRMYLTHPGARRARRESGSGASQKWRITAEKSAFGPRSDSGETSGAAKTFYLSSLPKPCKRRPAQS
jgi:transposase InsO family protein